MRLIPGIVLLFLTALLPKDNGTLPGVDYVAFQQGELLKYDLHFGMIHAGEAALQVTPDMKDIGGHPHFHVHIYGYSYKVFDAFYKVRDYYDSYVDAKSMLPTVFIRNILEGSYTKKEYYIFNRAKKEVTSNEKQYPVPADVHDIVSAFYYLRCIDFSKQKVGTFIPITTFFENDIFPIGITYTGKKTIETKFGKVRCMVFKPKLIEGRVFKSQSDMKIYVTEDKNQLPIRIESAVYLGSVRADLMSYENLKYPFSSIVPD